MFRIGTHDDYRRLVAMVRYQDNSYINKTLLKEDLTNNALYLIEENGKIKAVCSIVYDYKFKMFYMKRLFVSKQALRKGYGRRIIQEIMQVPQEGQTIAATPFGTNEKMITLIKSLGFKFQYTFLKDYNLFTFKA